MKVVIKFILIVFISTSCDTKIYNNTYPMEEKVITDTYFGQEVHDPYRYMENPVDTTVLNWLHLQEDYTKNIIRNISGWQNLRDRQNTYKSKNIKTSYLSVTKNDQYFYVKQNIDESYGKLYVRNNFLGVEELLFDQENYLPESKDRYLINYISPSRNGSKIAISLAKNDEEISQIIILDVSSKQLMPDVIDNCWPSELGGICWLPDDSGIIYTYIPVLDKSSANYLLNTSSVLYKLETDPKKAKVLLSKDNNPDIPIIPADFPIIYCNSECGDYILGGICGARAFNDYYFAKLSTIEQNIKWQPLFKIEDKISYFYVLGDDLIYSSAKDAPNYKICKISLLKPDFVSPEVLVYEDSNSVITDLIVSKKGIFYIKTKNGVEANLFQLVNGIEKQIIIPKKSGYINLTSFGGESENLWIEIEGWLNKPERYRYDIDKGEFSDANLYPVESYSILENAIVEEVEVISHDGVKVPLSIIYMQGIKLNGQNNLLMTGYGGSGYSWTPYLDRKLLNWVAEGGVYAVAHVRGGGEKGETWHTGGYKQTKPNTWKDFIACSEYLIEKGYTSKERNAAWSGSAGGILVGRAITERPDLYTAAAIEVGVLNTMRFEFGTNGKNYSKEIGTVEDSSEFVYLLEMDAYHHIKKGEKYPALYLTAGMNDARVPVWQPAKFAARIQVANVSNKPILFSVDFTGGHGFNADDNKINDEIADEISFLLWQTGHPDYKLKE
jgi:prolyl oligopeptidase